MELGAHNAAEAVVRVKVLCDGSWAYEVERAKELCDRILVYIAAPVKDPACDTNCHGAWVRLADDCSYACAMELGKEPVDNRGGEVQATALYDCIPESRGV